MPTTIIEDRQIRYVNVEHVCVNGGSTYRAAYIEVPGGSPRFHWGSELDINATHCGYCGEKLPQHPDEVGSTE